MAGNNGKMTFQPVTMGADIPAPALDAGRIGLALVPTTPVSFTGADALYAWGRLLLYGAVSYMTWKKYRTISYIALGAAGVSAATSLSATAWTK